MAVPEVKGPRRMGVPFRFAMAHVMGFTSVRNMRFDGRFQSDHETQAMKLPALLLALMASAAMADTPADEAQAMGERLAACAACHGPQGEGMPGSAYYPHLAGKPAGYLFAQLQGFRDGRRHYPQMVYLMRNWDDAWLAQIARHYASLPFVETRHATPPAQHIRDRDHAQALVEHGDASRDLPACASCHGPALNGIEPGVPALAGLPVDYLVAQLGGWMTGARHSIAPDCMSAVVHALQPGEIRLLAGYIATQVPAAGSRPAPAGTWELPRACGGTQALDSAHGVEP